MTGVQKITVSNRSAKFTFELHRNITIVRGDSGTGKTTLYTMIADYTRLGAASGVNLSCAKKCVALMDLDWKNQLLGISDSIVFIDEGSDFLTSTDFADAIKNSDNYYVIFNREGLHNLPYSVEEIYEIRTSGKFHKFKKLYHLSSEHICYAGRKPIFREPDLFLTEDSNAGFQFFEQYCKTAGKVCRSARSNSNIFTWLKSHEDRIVLIIADGAAFGSEIDRVMKLSGIRAGRVMVCLPESFEWLILRSGILHIEGSERIADILAAPSDYIESQQYFSWEQFFTAYLTQITQNTPFRYSKVKINPVYLNETNLNRIASEILHVDAGGAADREDEP